MSETFKKSVFVLVAMLTLCVGNVHANKQELVCYIMVYGKEKDGTTFSETEKIYYNYDKNLFYVNIGDIDINTPLFSDATETLQKLSRNIATAVMSAYKLTDVNLYWGNNGENLFINFCLSHRHITV